jgi:hypothetical protein
MPVDRKALIAAIVKDTSEAEKSVGAVAGAALSAGLRFLSNHCDALEKRIDELESKPFAYDGPHESGKAYRKGVFVTHDGSVWHCNYATTVRPGDGPAWTLAVKRGRDAR